MAATATTGRLSLQCEAIAADTTTIRSLDWDRSRFDIEFGLRNGTTYNSFLVRGERTALIDSSHLKFEATWLPLLQGQIDPRSIDHLIVSHTEPDHSGLIGHLLELHPELEIVGSKVAIQFLENQVHRPFNSRAVKSGDQLDLGTNPGSGVQHRFEFLSAPNLHWPDTIFSFDHGTGILYTCDAFGLHYCSEDVFDVDPGAIAPDFRFYYDCLMGPNARSVLQAMKRMDALPPISTIAVGHGPLLRHHLNLWLGDYRAWSEGRSKGEAYAAVCYLSQYGFCDRISQAIARGIGKAEAQVQLVDLRATDPQELSALIGEASAVVVPTWPANPDAELQAAIGTLLAALQPKQWVASYDAFGGNDEPIDTVASRLRSLGQNEAFEPLRIRQVPDGNDYQRCEEAGTDLGQLLTRAKTIAAMKALDGDLDKALGRLSGGLYVVTARQQERASAMVASWVSQASFEPPGITVAVAKDRAIEALLQVGDRFVLNILREDNHQPLLRHFLKRFPPGADRFAGVNTLEGVAAGGPVLGDALAFLGCRVQQRMEGPDHWIIYAEVEQGNVSDTEASTAVHHRKVGEPLLMPPGQQPDGADRSVIQIPLEPGLICLRGLSPRRLRFEVEYGLERGTSANSFLFEGGAGAAGKPIPPVLVHPPGDSFAAPFLEQLAALVPADAALKVVVGHVNPNRVALLRRLAAHWPALMLVASNAGARLLQDLWSQQRPAGPDANATPAELPELPPIDVVKQEGCRPLAHGLRLCLYPTPTPRWPGALMAFEERTGLLMSGKFFAAHLCSAPWAEANRSSTEEDRRYFYDCLMAPMARQVEVVLNRVDELPIRTIAPGHGPAISESWRSLLSDYRRWGAAQERAKLSVALLFASAYGNTAAIADALAQGVARTGVRVESINCEFTPPETLLEAIRSCDAVLIGSPTLGGHAPTPIVSALGSLLAEGDRAKPVGVFGSFGWSGEALDLLESKLRDGGFRFAFEPIKVKFSPDAATLKTCEETGTALGRSLQMEQRRQQRRSAGGGLSESRSNPAVQALGRVVGSLCVLTTSKGSGDSQLSGAMVASWVSQASFSPPGLTVAVAKDRAVEALLHVGDRFALNVLAAGRETAPMKQFLQPFAPGADRFAGLELERSPAGQPVLPDGVAWLDCQVKQRMECGDHWLIYAQADAGALLDAAATTAVHQRRSGANY